MQIFFIVYVGIVYTFILVRTRTFIIHTTLINNLSSSCCLPHLFFTSFCRPPSTPHLNNFTSTQLPFSSSPMLPYFQLSFSLRCWNLCKWGLTGTYKRVPSLVSSLVVRAVYCLAALHQPSTKYYLPHHTLFHLISPHRPPSNLGKQSCWAACLCVSAVSSTRFNLIQSLASSHGSPVSAQVEGENTRPTVRTEWRRRNWIFLVMRSRLSEH
jgi:hypothetical protein